MGTGKTASGQELSARLGWKFIDLDALIEAGQQKKISEIFAQQGEVFFRNLEKEALKQAASGDHQVISCGGGIVIDQENISLMKQSGLLVCLWAEPEVILDRTKATAQRPLLNVDDPLGKIKELLEKRKQYYLQADMTIDTSTLNVEQVAQGLERMLRDTNPKVL